MTKFEQIGSEIVSEARNVKDAKARFRRSCSICCNKGLRLSCERCAVSYTHDLTVASLKSAQGFRHVLQA